MPRAIAAVFTGSGLQWGRDQLVAEIRERVNQVVKVRCFNGAATNWSRKLKDVLRDMTEFKASMGPRPIGRGNVKNWNRNLVQNRLQWGRDQLVAEITTRRARTELGRIGFNGAATNWSRKSHPALDDERKRKRFNGAATNWSRK